MEIRFGNDVYDLSIKGLRKMLHNDVSDAIYDLELEYTDEEVAEIENIHTLISVQDVQALADGCFLDGELYFEIVESDDLLVEALKAAGYKVEKSNVSRSLYAINDEGVEVRISDHKRPAIEQNGIYEDVEYDAEIIIKDNIVYLSQLEANGFSKLNKAEYILG